MSIRRLYVLLSNLPAGSAVWCIESGLPFGFTVTDLLLTDLYAALTGESHPARPKPSSSSPPDDVVARLKAQRERLQSQRREAAP